MNKLKNIGITALAGTLVSLSAAQAGGVSVTGAWELSYTNLNHSKVTGNKLGVNKSISFGASGDLSDGGAVTWASTVGMSDAFGLSSSSLNLNMGGIATLAYDSGTGGYGANAVDNIVPTAWEEIDYGLSTGITDVGAVSATKGSVHFSVKAPTAGSGFSISYAPRMGVGHQADGATSSAGEASGKGVDVVLDFVDYDAAHFGFRWGIAGQMEFPEETCYSNNKAMEIHSGSSQASCIAGHKHNPFAGTMYTKLQLGPLHLGTQGTFKDPSDPTAAGIQNKRTIVAGAALVFGDTLSLSYGESWDRYKYNDACRGGESGSHTTGEINEQQCSGANLDGSGGEYETIKFQGWSAALNIGPVALKGTRNTVGGWGEGSSNTGEGLDKTHSEINLSIAF